MQSALQDAASFLTDDAFGFDFTQQKATAARQPYLIDDSAAAAFDADEVILFSGGLNSFAGALEALSEGDAKVVLVTHRSAQKAIRRQRDLAKCLERRFPGRTRHVQVRATRIGGKASESTQRSRSFLFAALGYVVARMFKARRLSFYENGVVSHNLPISPQVIGTMATRTTHPGALLRLGRLLDALSDSTASDRIRLTNPYAWLTKTEVVDRIAAHGGAAQIGNAVSCTVLRRQSAAVTHCGACSQCLDRRFAIVAAGLEDHDPSAGYETDVFVGPRQPNRSRTMALDWTRRAWEAAERDVAGLLATFASEVARIIAAFPDLNAGPALQKVHDLHRRHGASAREALARMQAQHSRALLEHTLPETSLLRMFVAERVGGEAALAPPPPAQVSERTVPIDPAPTRQRRALLPLQVAFEDGPRGRMVDVLDLQTIAGKQAEMLHALKVPFDEDRAAQVTREQHRYLSPRSIQIRGSKESLKMLVSRCRAALAEAYELVEGRPPETHLLVQSRKPQGYRLDPDIRVVSNQSVTKDGVGREE